MRAPWWCKVTGARVTSGELTVFLSVPWYGALYLYLRAFLSLVCSLRLVRR